MDKTLLDFAMIVSVLIGYFVSISLVTTSFYKSRANNYLSLSISLLASMILMDMLITKVDSIALDILNLFMLDFLFAATLFTYFLIQIQHKFLDSPRYKWIYFPFIGSIILEISLLFLDLYGSIYDIIIYYLKDFASIIFNVILIFLGRQLILKSNTVSQEKKPWLLRLNLFIVCIIIIWILTRVEVSVFNSMYTTYILWVLLSLFLWWVLYHGVFKLQIIVQKEEIHDYLVLKKTTSSPIKRKINSTTTTKIITQLYTLMEDEEVYKNPLLSRLDLAIRLDTSESYLSQIINQELNKSVTQFVNEYRIEAAKNLLNDSVFNKYSIEAIGMEAGFKSKSAFYSAFNQSLKMSPGAYRKLQKKS
ncbi:helix-turn-helix domain-containing protein [Aquimarina sp. 2201CG1-2-11]|uniref:helix-turn-helix domain-containing protein n=1 Tax=Aquimarina discodermiae TaxID=3231043 RepID=UPI003462A7E0